MLSPKEEILKEEGRHDRWVKLGFVLSLYIALLLYILAELDLISNSVWKAGSFSLVIGYLLITLYSIKRLKGFREKHEDSTKNLLAKQVNLFIINLENKLPDDNSTVVLWVNGHLRGLYYYRDGRYHQGNEIYTPKENEEVYWTSALAMRI